MLNKIKGGLVVSCQALPHEPLHSSFIMGRMAKAAEEGGAVGIRANTKEDIIEIRKNTNLPIVGIVKRDYDSTPIYITATLKEVKELLESPCEMIAFDATNRVRYNNEDIFDFVKEIKKIAPNKLLMADIATLDEAIRAEKLGVDCISTTLIGYTEESKGDDIAADDFKILRDILANVKIPVIAEGHVDTPAKARRAIDIGAHAVVTGSMITRPQLITKKFVEEMKK